MHVAWCCVSVLKSDPKIPKSRDRRPKFSRYIEITEGCKIQDARCSVITDLTGVSEVLRKTEDGGGKLLGSIERKSEG